MGTERRDMVGLLRWDGERLRSDNMTASRDFECCKISTICSIVSRSPPKEGTMDWLSRLFEMMPVRGRLDFPCSYAPPCRIHQRPAQSTQIPYHPLLAGPP